MPYLLTRGSRPEAALIPYEDFLHFQALKEQEVLARYDELVAPIEASRPMPEPLPHRPRSPSSKPSPASMWSVS